MNESIIDCMNGICKDCEYHVKVNPDKEMELRELAYRMLHAILDVCRTDSMDKGYQMVILGPYAYKHRQMDFKQVIEGKSMTINNVSHSKN